MTGRRRLHRVGLGLDPEQEIHDVAQAEVMDVRPLPATPTEVVAHALLWDAGQGVIERVDVPGLYASVLLQRGSWKPHVPRFAQPWIVDLKDESGLDNGPVFGFQGLGDREHVFFFG